MTGRPRGEGGGGEEGTGNNQCYSIAAGIDNELMCVCGWFGRRNGSQTGEKSRDEQAERRFRRQRAVTGRPKGDGVGGGTGPGIYYVGIQAPRYA